MVAGTFDGRYIYFSPLYNGVTYYSKIMRLDTTKDFQAADSYEVYDAVNTNGLDTSGFTGALFDGRYVYFNPKTSNSTGYHGRVLRYDTRGSFSSPSSWTAYDAGNTGGLTTVGYFGSVGDGKYIYFVPGHDNAANGWHGRVLRYNTTADFNTASSWSSYDAGNTGGLNTKGYEGGIFDGRYIYFVPSLDNTSAYHGRVLRYDTTGDFNTAGSWTAYDATTTDGLNTVGFTGGTFDGRYIYFSPTSAASGNHARSLRYDTTGSFTASTSWSAYDAGNTNGSNNTKGYGGASYDGKYVYYFPYWYATGGYHGRVLRYDTTGAYKSASSWSSFDAGSTDGLETKGYLGGISDGRYIYTVPLTNNSGIHGNILRMKIYSGGLEPTISNKIGQSSEFYIDSGSRIGIGTILPGSKLTVASATAGNVIAVRNTADSTDTFVVTDTGTTFVGGKDANGDGSELEVYDSVAGGEARVRVRSTSNGLATLELLEAGVAGGYTAANTYGFRLQYNGLGATNTFTLSESHNGAVHDYLKIYKTGNYISIEGNTLQGNTTAGGNLNLSSTTNATKGKIMLGTASAYDEANVRLGVGVTAPTAVMHLKAGTAAASTAPIKLTTGTLMATPEIGAVEYDGTSAYITLGDAVRREIMVGHTGTTASIGGGALAAGACASANTTVTGAATTMTVTTSPNTYPGDGHVWQSYVSAADTVTTKVCAIVAGTPTAGTYNIRVIK
jgi:hypothetical protein